MTVRQCTLSAEYNINLAAACQKLGGKWSDKKKAWVFKRSVVAKVRALESIYNSERVSVELTAERAVRVAGGTLSFCGRPLARGFFPDDGVKLVAGVTQVAGRIASVGVKRTESSRRPALCIQVDAGTVLRTRVPAALLTSDVLDGFTARRLDQRR